MKIEGAFLRSRVARRIVALFVLCALVPIGATALLSYYRVQELLLEQGFRQLAQTNEAYATALYDRLLAAHLDLGGRPNHLEAGPLQWSAEFTQHLKDRFDSLAIVRPDGSLETLLGSPPALPELTEAERNRLAMGGAVLRTVAPAEGPSFIFLARTVEASKARPGILVAELNEAYLWGNPADYAPLTDICVVDDQGVLLYCSQPDPPAVLREMAHTLPPKASGRFEFAQMGEMQFASHRELFLEPRFLVQGWTVIATRPESEVLAPVGAFKLIFMPAIVLSLLLVALLSMTQVRRTLVPLEKLIEGTRRAADKDFSVRVDIPSDDEFGELAASFNSMSARLGSQFTALTTLADIDRAILSRLDVDRVIESVIMRIRDIVPAQCVSIAMLDRTATGMMRIYTRDQRSEGGLELERSACSIEDTRELLSHAEGMWLDAREPKPYAVPVIRLGAGIAFVSPIVWHDAVIGALVLGLPAGATLTDEERARARDLGDRVGVAFATATKDEQLYYQGHYDALTELPNRLYFRDQLDRALAQAGRDGQRFALLFIDLDYFKRVNDSVGHAAGDRVLRDAAARMRRCVRNVDIVARLGGDEFTMLLSDIRTTRDPQIVADKVIAAMSAPFVIADHDHYLNASIGIALYPNDGITADDLLRNADTAMYRAKESGRGRCVYFEERMNADAIMRVRLERDLHHALDRQEFALHYQPQLDLATGRISGAEALLRWNHPERGLLGPMHFIDLAEETGLIDRLGEWVLREACAQFRLWQDQGVALPRVGVNVSARQFKQKGFVNLLTRIVREAGMHPSALEVEITESLLLDATRSVESMLAKLKTVGVQIALDDFGTGYSSLAYLKRFPVDIVKIDRSFIKDLPSDEGSAAITGAIIAMAHALHKKVVAEGVVNAEQEAYLRGLRCDYIQGYHLSMPLIAPELAELVRRTESRAGIGNACHA